MSLEVQRLLNSVQHLLRSNTELAAFLIEDDDEEFNQSIQENEMTIKAQQERLEMIRIVLQDKLGIEATNSHYAIVEQVTTTIQPQRQNISSGPTGGIIEEEDNQNDDGIHL
jgi:C4-type Zn-finger protein